MKPDILIRNGRVMDPARSVDAVQDVAIVGDRIVAVPAGCTEAKQVIDAADCLVFPGLVDFHTHLFHSGAVTPVKPDLLLATGVTAAVDAGTSGCANYDAFYRADIVPSHLRIKTFIHVSSGGMPDEWMPEDMNPAYFNESSIRRVVERYGDKILGLKVRLTKSLHPSIEPLEKTLEIAEKIGNLKVCVHVTDAPCTMEQIADRLRPGDVFCHVYHGRGNTILDTEGRVWPALRRARDRGVLFDSSHGKGNFSHQVAQRAIAEGFWPDLITTDIGDFKIYISHWARSLPFLMSKHLCMGMDFEAVLRAVTVTPAEQMGLAGHIGTLAPGARADVALFKLEDRRVRHQDSFDTAYYGEKLLIPQFVICRGDYVWGAADFNLE